MFQHACKMGLEGIVSKRLGSRYRSGRSPDWLKFKNPAAPAVIREAEEDWSRDTMRAAMGAATFIKSKNPNSKVAVGDLQTGQLTVLPTPATAQQ